MDITLKNIPDEIVIGGLSGEAAICEWVGIAVERFHNAKLNQIKEVVQATEAAKTGIDSFRTANALAPKFAKAEEKVEEKPKVEDAITTG